MRKALITMMLLMLVGCASAFGYQSLQEVYDNAPPGMTYDKYVTLDREIEYEGDLVIDEDLSVAIMGNGAKIFTLDNGAAVTIEYAKLHISGCVIIGGRNGLFFGYGSYGRVYNNTIVDSDSAGVFSYYPEGEYNLEIYNNIITGCRFGIAAVEDFLPVYVGYNILYDCWVYNYAQFCPGWGWTVEPFDPYPGTGELDEDPMFASPGENNYDLREGSPAIGSGRWEDDRGARPYQPTGVDDETGGLPINYAEIHAFPNPFNSQAVIEYALPEAADVKLEIFNIMGQKESVLIDQSQSAGQHSALWDASNNNSGIYFARLSYGHRNVTGKLVLVK